MLKKSATTYAMKSKSPRIVGKREFLEWARRQSPLSSLAKVIFVPSGRRFSINVRTSDLKWCFFEDATDRSWEFEDFLKWAATQTRSIAFDVWQCRLRLPKT